MIDYEKMFTAHKVPNSFSLIDATHPLEYYIGIDERGRKTLVLRNVTKPDCAKSTTAIDISIGQVKNNIWSIGFHLKDNSMSGLFNKFCDDLVESSRNIASVAMGMTFVVKRYSQWKKMFYKLKKDLLSESEIMGLIGELLFLRQDMFEKNDKKDAIDSWSGCDKTHKDFSIADDWFEIKAVHSGALSVKISSLEQLESDTSGFLVVFELEKMSGAFDGITLNGLIGDILSDLTLDLKDELIEKLKEVGYFYDDEYDKYVYRLISKKYFIVNQDFPMIRSTYISPSIVRVQYEILLNNLKEFRVK